ncbi:Crp/Fnr family transcriptional regulator [Marivirga sp.]|uniref:Crp/Fnr family transcriptional regulator n=1 Tax=Marivirga sp. TaxID=2018662 RepID=UPI002D80C431|nr:Crp/Fnr family transcriptional regulator [Marivirga sp.]HET8861349.1 Crp/Fnr family transcriptional regulator [Marivirga sp.]
MTQDEVAKYLKEKAGLSSAHLDYFFEKAKLKSLPKNIHLIRNGEYSVHFVLIKTGCLMTYFKDPNEHVHAIQFGQEMWWTGDLDAIFNQHPSNYAIKALTPSEVYLLSKEDFEDLNQKHPAFESYFRKLFQNALISHQKRIIRNISFTAEEKYLEFVKLHPRLELIVPQKYIASYMGITPEFLSKLKRKLAQS